MIQLGRVWCRPKSEAGDLREAYVTCRSDLMGDYRGLGQGFEARRPAMAKPCTVHGKYSRRLRGKK